jgi:hypothetical protein
MATPTTRIQFNRSKVSNCANVFRDWPQIHCLLRLYTSVINGNPVAPNEDIKDVVDQLKEDLRTDRVW